MLTLDNLAHFDRCMFPKDMQDALIGKGIHPLYAKLVADYITNQRKKGCNVSIVSLYQAYIEDHEITRAFISIVDDFINK